jgi:hypothetical protein
LRSLEWNKRDVAPRTQRRVRAVHGLVLVMALRNGIGVFEAARNMGTSVQPIPDCVGSLF